MPTVGARLTLHQGGGSDLPGPLTPPDCDLRDFPRMGLDVQRLLSSGFNAKASAQPIAWMMGVKLWCRSWHQVPAASLPDDDAELAHLAELGSTGAKVFRKHRPVALHGWVTAADGRLYHPVIAELALVAWLEKLNNRYAGLKGNAERWKTPFDASEIEAEIAAAVDLLRALNPQNKAIARVARRASQRQSGKVAE